MMKSKFTPFLRRDQVLQALYEHGPLSRKGLQKILSPSISERALQIAIARLRGSGLIIRRNEELPQKAGDYYQISRSKIWQSTIQKILNVSADKYFVPNFRSHELLHSQICAIWATKLKSIFPNARVVRDFMVLRDVEAKEIVNCGLEGKELIPDLILIIPRGESLDPVNIAIEIENSKKAYSRYQAKIEKLTSQTRIDGVIYLCTRRSILESLVDAYVTEGQQSGLRVRHYRKGFLLIGEVNSTDAKDDPDLFNSNGNQVFLRDWVNTLCASSIRARRDAQFERLSLSRKPTVESQRQQREVGI